MVYAGTSCLNSIPKSDFVGFLGFMLHDPNCECNDSRVLSYFAACFQSSSLNANVRLSSFCSRAIADRAPVVGGGTDTGVVF